MSSIPLMNSNGKIVRYHMPRPKIAIRISRELHDKLKAYCEQHGLGVYRVAEEWIQDRLGRQVLTDEDMDKVIEGLGGHRLLQIQALVRRGKRSLGVREVRWHTTLNEAQAHGLYTKILVDMGLGPDDYDKRMSGMEIVGSNG